MWPRKTLHNRRAAPGLERKILRQMPWLVAGNVAVPLLMMGLARVLSGKPLTEAVAKHLMSVDIAAIALGLTFATALLTLVIGCVIVMVMKGPAYVADPYELADHDAEEDADKRRRF